jgi:hypothetical protein
VVAAEALDYVGSYSTVSAAATTSRHPQF